MFKSAVTRLQCNTYAAAAFITILLQTVSMNAAHANVEFSVDFVSTGSGNFLTGSFTTNNALSQIVSYDIKAPQSGAFSGFEYTMSDSSVTAQSLPSQFFRIDSSGNINELQFYFLSSLTQAGGVLLPFDSYESEPSGGNRLLSGDVVPAVSGVPEPSSWAMMLLGFGGLGFLAYRKTRARSGQASLMMVV